jgi:hypothetical protein
VLVPAFALRFGDIGIEIDVVRLRTVIAIAFVIVPFPRQNVIFFLHGVIQV